MSSIRSILRIVIIYEFRRFPITPPPPIVVVLVIKGIGRKIPPILHALLSLQSPRRQVLPPVLRVPPVLQVHRALRAHHRAIRPVPHRWTKSGLKSVGFFERGREGEGAIGKVTFIPMRLRTSGKWRLAVSIALGIYASLRFTAFVVVVAAAAVNVL
ncbi:unnamed protein product [Rodentolepis nana]|uniref:Transmembrane protein n=1 Tax=Rodentolepis nana TaxID=102285 RepID=A0A0R3TBH0_RODNA|nr:unnamed protein product [Rodentolepis nana]